MTAMTVTRVHTEQGSHIEPPLDDRWTEFHALRWHAGVVRADCGIEVDVRIARSWTDGVRDLDVFSIVVGRAVVGPFGYGEAVAFLNGVTRGAKARS